MWSGNFLITILQRQHDNSAKNICGVNNYFQNIVGSDACYQTLQINVSNDMQAERMLTVDTISIPADATITYNNNKTPMYITSLKRQMLPDKYQRRHSEKDLWRHDGFGSGSMISTKFGLDVHGI